MVTGAVRVRIVKPGNDMAFFDEHPAPIGRSEEVQYILRALES
jgi:hypothetical protein